MKVKIVNKSIFNLPKYETIGSAGMDLRAFIKEPIILRSGERKLIPTGIHIQLESGYEAQIRSRSGMTLKKGLCVANGVGTIDCDYRGEIGVILHNIGNVVQTIESGERVAQMIIAKYERAEWVEVEELDPTDRGEGGFGSTNEK